MAAEVGSAPVNGYGHNAPASNTNTNAPAQTDVTKEQVAWYFVESYYTTMSQNPEKLHLFFNKRSQLVSGVEEEKSSVALGQKAIKERLSELDFQDCKVRVTNVDSQASDSTIVIQVIGEMSNKSQPHRKFVQTFILASQTNGYFVLNDIFRYIKDDVDEEEVEGGEDEEIAAEEPVESAAPVAAEETVVEEKEAEILDGKLEEVAKSEAEEKEAAPAAAVNGTPVPESAEVAEADEAPAAAVSAPDAAKSEELEKEVAEEDLAEPEKPTDPLPTPKNEAATPATSAPAPAAAAPSAPPKPAVPRSWAQLAAGNQAKAAAASAPAPRAAPAPSASQPKTTPSAPAAQPAAAPSAPRDASPDSAKEGSTGGWQTAGADHTRKPSKPANAVGGSDGRVRAFVKNVTEEVDADALKSVLAKFGEIVYFDVARQKKAAFVEYKTVAGFTAAVNASPLRVGNEEVWVEERRVGGYPPRGGARGGRGGYEGRGGAPRGGFGPRGGRGGSGNVTPRGGRGGAQS